jgi:hypothetical protein
MEATVKKVWLSQLVFPAIQFGLLALIAYISIYKFGNYDPKFGPGLSLRIHYYLIAFATAITSLLYSITFLLNIHSAWSQIKALPFFKLLLPITICSVIQVGIYFLFERTGWGIGLWLWLFLIPPALAWLSLKFLHKEQQAPLS